MFKSNRIIQFSTSFISWATGAVWGTAIVEIFLAALKVWGSSWLKVSGNFKTQRPEIRMGTPIIEWPQWWSLEDKSLLGVGFFLKNQLYKKISYYIYITVTDFQKGYIPSTTYKHLKTGTQ